MTRTRHHAMTTIEVMLVFAAIAIVGVITALSAVAVLDSSEERKGEANAQQVLLAQQQFASKYGSYTGRPEDLGEFEEFAVTEDPSNAPDEISITVSTSGNLGIAVLQEDACIVILAGSPASGGGARTSTDSNDYACDGANAFGSDESEEAPGDDGRPPTKLW